MFLDTPKVKKQTGFEPLPKGVYRAIISKAEGKDSQAGGRYISLCFDVFEGNYKGRKVWDNITTKHSNEKAVQIGHGKLKAIAEALDHPQPFKLEGDYLKFVRDKVCRIKVGQRLDKQTDEMKNVINDYLPDTLDDGLEPSSSDPRSSDDIPW